jgi:hypothetical protein
MRWDRVDNEDTGQTAGTNGVGWHSNRPALCTDRRWITGWLHASVRGKTPECRAGFRKERLGIQTDGSVCCNDRMPHKCVHRNHMTWSVVYPITFRTSAQTCNRQKFWRMSSVNEICRRIAILPCHPAVRPWKRLSDILRMDRLSICNMLWACDFQKIQRNAR